jgi:predicted RND superfamily exporter protein
MTAIVSFLIRFRIAVLIIMGVITVFFAAQIMRMEMFTQFLDLFPSTHPYVQVHKQYEKYFGGAYQATLVLELKEKGKYKDVFNLETLNKMQRIQYDVDLIPGVDHFAIYSIASPKVTYVKETPEGFSSKPMMKEVPKNKQELEDLKKKVFTSHVYGTLVSRDQKAILLNANFIEGRIDFNKLFDAFMKIKQKEEDANHKIYLSGMPLIYGWIYHYVPMMGVIFLITSFIIVAMLFGYMRQGGLWWRPFLDGIITSIWGLGFSAWMGFHFDPLIIVIPFLLSARAMSHGVQWTERFVEEYRRLNGDIKKAALITGVALFPPGLIGIVADTWALLIIAITPIPTLRNLAFIGTFWALSAVFSSLVLNPALFASFKKLWIPMEYKENTFDRILKRILTRLSGWTFGSGRYITVGIAMAVLILAIISSRSLKFGDANPGTPILWPDSEYNLDVKHTNDNFPGVDQMWLVIEGKGWKAVTKPDVIKGMEALKQYMMEDPNVGFATSVADLIKNVNMLAHGNDPKRASIPTEDLAISHMLTLYAGSTSPGEMDQWFDPNLQSSNVRLYLKNHEGTLLVEVIDRVRNFIQNNPKLMENAVAKPAGGLGGILAAANEVIAKRNDPILIFILAVIFVHCSLTYWSVLAGVIFTISLILANFLAFTYMAMKGIGLNINTFPVVSLGIGMGVDYGLYIVSRIIEVYREEKDLGKSVRGGITTAGRAVFFTATMMTAGVIFWYFSPIRFQAEMGILLGVLLMVNMVVGVLVLPAVINIIRPKFITNPKW